jgi:hypothetical protein
LDLSYDDDNDNDGDASPHWDAGARFHGFPDAEQTATSEDDPDAELADAMQWEADMDEEFHMHVASALSVLSNVRLLARSSTGLQPVPPLCQLVRANSPCPCGACAAAVHIAGKPAGVPRCRTCSWGTPKRPWTWKA